MDVLDTPVSPDALVSLWSEPLEFMLPSLVRKMRHAIEALESSPTVQGLVATQPGGASPRTFLEGVACDIERCARQCDGPTALALQHVLMQRLMNPKAYAPQTWLLAAAFNEALWAALRVLHEQAGVSYRAACQTSRAHLTAKAGERLTHKMSGEVGTLVGVSGFEDAGLVYLVATDEGTQTWLSLLCEAAA